MHSPYTSVLPVYDIILHARIHPSVEENIISNLNTKGVLLNYKPYGK